MMTTKKKHLLSSVALPWKKHEFSRVSMRPEGKHRSTKTTKHRQHSSRNIVRRLVQVLVISEQMSLVF